MSINYTELIKRASMFIENKEYVSAITLSREFNISFDEAQQLFSMLKEQNIINKKTWKVGTKIDQVMINAHEKTADYKKNVIAVRVTESINEILENLVTLSIAKSKSEAAYMLIVEGIKAQPELIMKFHHKKNEMEILKSSILNETEGIGRFGKI